MERRKGNKKSSKRKKKIDLVDFKTLFKFQSFTERVANIRINVIHHVSTSTSDAPEERETFFNEALEKWKELNCTLDFVGFQRAVQQKVNSLAQLLFHKEEVISELQRRLAVKDTLAYEPLLDLLVQLARDLQKEFYPHFKAFFPLLVAMCDSHDADVIKCVFNSFAYLFKFLWRHMLKDLENVFCLYSELMLQSQKPHIRQFAVESFGFLLRKVHDQDKLITMILHSLSPELCEGVGQLLFEWCRGVPHQFHSCCEPVLSLLLDQLGCAELCGDLVLEALCTMVRAMAGHTRREFAEPVWLPLLNNMDSLKRRWQEREGEGEEQLGGVPLPLQLGRTLHLIGIMASWRNGALISKQERLFQSLLEVLGDTTLPRDTLNTSLHLAASLIVIGQDSRGDRQGEEFGLSAVTTVCGCGREEDEEEVKMVLNFFQEITKDIERFMESFLVSCVQYCEGALTSKDNKLIVLKFLTELCLLHSPHTVTDSEVTVLPSTAFVLELCPSEEKLSRRQPLTRSAARTLGDSRVVSMLIGCLEAGLRELKERGTSGGGGRVRPDGGEEGGGEREVLKMLWCSLVCLQFARPVPELVVGKLQELYSVLKELLRYQDSRDQDSENQDTGTRDRDRENWDTWCFLLAQTLSTVVGVVSKGKQEMGVVTALESVLDVVKLHPSSLPLLISANHYLTVLSDAGGSSPFSVSDPSPLSAQMLRELLPALLPNLSSPNSAVRLVTLQILCLFDQVPMATRAGGQPVADVLEICLTAERVPANLQSYRNKALWLQKLQYSSTYFNLLPKEYTEIPLRYLVGTLYVNFNLLWEPTIEIMSSYAVEENMQLFWGVLGEMLNKVSGVIENPPSSHQHHSRGEDIGTRTWHESVADLFWYQTELLSGMECRCPDHSNHRILLWKCLSGISLSMTEPRSRILVPLLFRFINNEYSLNEDVLQEYQDLRIFPSTLHSETEQSTHVLSQHACHVSKKNLTQTLLTMLRVFVKFRNPKSFYKKDEIWQLYMKLLTHRQSEVQVLALGGLMTFKPPYLLPYRENFERLLDDSTFREELVSFRVDSECAVVSSEHRGELLPILMRVLYGRMQRQGGHNTTKAGGAGRRGLVLRFLGGCEGNELTEFIDLLVLPFREILTKDDGEETDASRVVPLKKQQGFLNMVGQLVSILGPTLLPHVSRVLKLVIHLGAASTRLLEHRELLQPHVVSALKALRQLAITRITQCFEKFTEYDFSPLHSLLLSSFVWPQLDMLPHVNVQSPTPLLRLLHTWTTHPQYWCLLASPCTLNHTTPPSSSGVAMDTMTQTSETSLEGSSSVILKSVFECLSSPKTSPKVCSFVMEMAVNLLTLDANTGGDYRPVAMETGVTMETGGEGLETSGGGVTVSGEELVLPFLPRLLGYLSLVIGGCVGKGGRGREGKGRSLEYEFVVLSRISSFVDDPEKSCVLIKLLLPFLLHQTDQYKKYEESILESVCSLVVKTSSLSQFIRPLAQLFGVLKDRTSRTKLCLIFQRISDKYEQWNKTAEIVAKLNSWDSRLIDEPDYDRRLEGFLEAKEMLTSGAGGEGSVVVWSSLLVDLVSPFFHTALFYLLQCPDMSVRDAAASYISEVIKTISLEDEEVLRHYVLQSATTTVKQGLRSKQDFARQEAIDMLSQLVQTYGAHPKFNDMTCLYHQEPEADFFLNVKHIQLHRRTRALRKLARVCSDSCVGQASCLSFLLPLANHVIFKTSTNTEQNLVAEAVNVAGAISRLLSWGNYSFILGHYLRQLSKSREFQKNLIKVVIAVLDNFHFDLSLISSDLCDKDDHTHSAGTTSDKPESGVAMDVTEGSKVKEEERSKVGEEEEEEPEVEEGMGEEEAGHEEEKSKALAKKIYRSIVKTILPNLQQVLTRKVEVAGHKLSQQLDQDEDSEVLRVPVAMAMTKLLLALPEKQLHTNLPNLLLKVCLTLKNRFRDVRDVGRSTLVKMAAALGPKYLKYIIKEMKDALTRGYMLHVLSYSLHYLLQAMSSPPPSSTPSSSSPPSPLTVGDLDPCLELVSGILVEDLFGGPAEERECGENVAKIPESKTPQSLNSYEIVSRYLSPKLLPDLLSPVKDVLETQCNSRTSRVVEEVFRRVAVGIRGNLGFTPQALLVFIFELLSDSIPQLAPRPKPKAVITVDPKLRPADHRLLPPNPGRSGPRPIQLGNVGASIVTEFGLQLFHVSLKHSKFDTSDSKQLQMLDPFVPLLKDTLSSPHTKVLSRALHCLVWVVRMPLPSLMVHVESVAVQLFALLQRHTRAGMAAGNNRELVLSAFKAMTVIVRDFKKHDVSEDELKLLLSFVDEDIHDYQRQSTAFPLLKAILSRKLVSVEMYELMQKVMSLSLSSDSEHVRLQCRQALLQFMMDYPLGKKLNRYLDFHVMNLGYESQSGRESMLEQFNSIFTKFPKRLLNRHATYFFVPLSLRLLVEESPTCRQMVAAAIKTLLSKLDTVRSNEIALIIEMWIKDNKLLHKRLGMQTLGLLLETESQSFTKRLSTFLPLLHQCLQEHRHASEHSTEVRTGEKDVGSGCEDAPSEGEEERGRGVKDVEIGSDIGGFQESEGEEDGVKDVDFGSDNGGECPINEGEGEGEGGEEGGTEEDKQRQSDRLLFSALSTLNKMCRECDLVSNSSTALPLDMNSIWDEVCSLLLHPHAWVRLSSLQLLGLLFASRSPDDLVSDVKGSGRAESGGCGPKKRKRKRGRGVEVVEEEGGSSGRHYLAIDTVNKVHELCHLSCVQLQSPLLNAELANQAIKNLVFLAKVLHRLQLAGQLLPSDKDSCGSEEREGRRGGERDLQWLVRRMSRLANYEAGYHPKESIKRTHVFQWMAAVALDLGPSHLPAHLPLLLPPLHRELADTSHSASSKDLSSLAQEVVDLMKGVCGKEVFSTAYASMQRGVAVARERRRGQAALELVVNPEKGLLRKRRKNELKRESKRRRVHALRPDGTAAAKQRMTK